MNPSQENPIVSIDPSRIAQAWFGDMIDHCIDYAELAKSQGKPIIGILCEYAPRELILAAGGIPVCLCGGSAGTIQAAEEVLPSNLCPLIKSTFGYHLKKANPFLEMMDLIVAETTCDGKIKMLELMAESRPVYILELPKKADSSDGLDRWTEELRKLKAHLENQFHLVISDDALRQAIRTMNRERSLRRSLAGLMKSSVPPLTGRELLQFKSTISCIPADLEMYEKALFALRSAQPAANARTPVRVLLTGVPVVHGAERVVDIIEEHGGLVVCQENCTGLKPILEDVDEATRDPIRALAEKYIHLPCSVKTPNWGRFESIRALAIEYRADCVIDLIWQACLTYDVESFHIKRMSERELSLPYLKIQTDYSPSDSARIAVRVEALFEMVRKGN